MFTRVFHPRVKSGRWKGRDQVMCGGGLIVCSCPQMVKTTGGPAIGASVSSPALTNAAVTLLQDNLNEEERQLWTSLGPNWTLPRLDHGTSTFQTAKTVCSGSRAHLK